MGLNSSTPTVRSGYDRGMLAALLLTTFAADAPNVLFIAVDDLGRQLGCYGDVAADTPHIDRLAAEGVCFLNAYNQLPLCNPTRASVMTGLRPDRIGVYDLDRHFREAVPELVTLPQVFRNAGRRAERIGKIYHYNVPAGIGTDGLDDPPSWDAVFNPVGRDKTDEADVVNAEPHRKISAALSWLEAEGTAEEQTDGLSATRAIERLEAFAADGTPFFLAVGFFRPHTPYIAPAAFFDRHPLVAQRLPFAPAGDRDDIPKTAFAHNNPVPNYGLDEPTLRKATQAYYACVSMVDAQVGRMLATLDATGLAESTTVVLWSDHGYHLGQHNGVWQKRTLFEESASAPLVIRSPCYAGGPCRRVVEFVDIYPTVCELAGLTPPGGLDGRSLVPLLRDPRAEWNGVAVTQVVRPPDDRFDRLVMGRSVRTQRYRYTEWDGGDLGRELYDHHADPGEFANLAADSSAADAALMSALRNHFDGRAVERVPDVPVNPARL